jgi:hypothetical protein
LPRVLQLSAEFVVNGNLRREFEADDWDVDRIRMLLETSRAEGVALDGAGLAYVIRKNLEHQFGRLLQAPTDLGLLQKVETMLSLVAELTFEVNLWRAQNVYYHLLQTVYPSLKENEDEESRVWIERFQGLGERLGFAVRLVTAAPTAVAA